MRILPYHILDNDPFLNQNPEDFLSFFPLSPPILVLVEVSFLWSALKYNWIITHCMETTTMAWAGRGTAYISKRYAKMLSQMHHPLQQIVMEGTQCILWSNLIANCSTARIAMQKCFCTCVACPATANTLIESILLQ